MLDNPWSAVGNPTSALGPSGLAPLGIHDLLLSNLTTVCVHIQQRSSRDARRVNSVNVELLNADVSQYFTVVRYRHHRIIVIIFRTMYRPGGGRTTCPRR